MKCPHCGKPNCVDGRLYKNVEFYGSDVFNLPCTKCGKMIRVQASRTVYISRIGKSSVKKCNSDFA